MKVAQRFIAIILIFLIWILVFGYVNFLNRSSDVTSIPCPKETIGIVKINPRNIFSKILFDYSFRNGDPKMMKTVSEYYQNWVQDTSSTRIPIDFSENFCLIKLKIKGENVWVLAGKSIANSLKSQGFVRKGFYYEIVSRDRKVTALLNKHLKYSEWFNTSLNLKKALTYELIDHQQIKNQYTFTLNKQELVICCKNIGSTTMIIPDSTRSYFHLSTRLNKGSFFPEKYADLKVLTDKLAGFSFTYYGAKYVDSEQKGTYLDPDFDLLFNFSQKTKLTELTKILRKVAKEEVRIESDWIYLNRARYRLKSINDSTIFIGRNTSKLTEANGAFTMMGKPWVLTEIKDLGWKGGLLELIPEYRALKDFSESVAFIDIKSACNNDACYANEMIKSKCVKNVQKVRIRFKPGTNARLETFRVLLTMANAYQFQQDQ
ncbi:MAG: hypothetical protein ACKO4Y_05050 [Flavobacteriales bacterium]